MGTYYDDGYFHVYNRGAHKEPIFRSRKDYTKLCYLTEEYAEEYHVDRVCYCLMPNHYHLVLHQESGGSVSSFLKATFNAYSQSRNNAWGHRGTLFEANAKGRPIESEAYILNVVRYVHMNPVEAGLVSRPEEWEFSDYREWIGLKKGEKKSLSIRDAYFTLGEDYRRFVEFSSLELKENREFLRKLLERAE